MNLWIQTERRELDKLLKKIHGLVLNDGEARLLTDKKNLIQAARDTLKMGPKFVVIKKGEHGCLMVSDRDVFVLPAYPGRKVVDPTGAGDSFAGGMMGYLPPRETSAPQPSNAPWPSAPSSPASPSPISPSAASPIPPATRSTTGGKNLKPL
jgi:cytidine kinase